MVTLGVLARVHVPVRQQTLSELEQLDGVSSFSVEEPQRVGLLIERPTLELAHATLIDQVEKVPGVLGAWPVFSHFETSDEAAHAQ